MTRIFLSCLSITGSPKWKIYSSNKKCSEVGIPHPYSKARQGKRSHSFCSRDDRMRHNISTLWKGEQKLFEPNFEIKDVTVFVNDDARYMGRTEWCWQDCSQMLCRDVHFWEKWWNSNFSSVGNSLFFKIIQYLLSIYL